MRILVDSLGSQVQVQFQGAGGAPPQRRLNTLFGAMQSSGTSLKLGNPKAKDPLWQTAFSCGAIDAAQLDPCQVFFVMTHYYYKDEPVPSFKWSESELDAITAFVEKGGGLLLMSNHADYPTFDIALAARFGVTLQNVAISSGGYMKMSGDRLNQDAFGQTLLFGVDSLVAHDGCGISVDPTLKPPSSYRWIAKFPSNATSDGKPVPDDWYFALHATIGKGQVIVVANSGIAGDYDGAPQPACGQVTAGSNLMFILNCLRLLGGQPQAQQLGYCPGGQG